MRVLLLTALIVLSSACLLPQKTVVITKDIRLLPSDSKGGIWIVRRAEKLSSNGKSDGTGSLTSEAVQMLFFCEPKLNAHPVCRTANYEHKQTVWPPAGLLK